jgi:hypothetical protein
MIKIKQVRYIPQWGNILMTRLAKAGFKTINENDTDNISLLAQIGPKRIWNLKKYMIWYKKHGRYLTKHENYEIYDNKDIIIIRFTMKVKDIIFYKITGRIDKNNNVSGTICIEKFKKRYCFNYRVTDKSYWFDNMPVTNSVKALMNRMKEVVRTRRGV